ncbi:hypothetical protein [Hydrogenophaga sp. MI9]|uniref:hypothetical protein n=1 Tax=Hydrogenophaga sp. MI9 TaxID=3453719 RepID=UPI003EED0A50
MLFIQFEVRPQPDSQHFSSVGGAVANCFVEAESEDAARQLAANSLQDNGWEVLSVEDGPVFVERSDLEDPDWLAWFDQAAADGECYVFHQWPPEAQEDDQVH